MEYKQVGTIKYPQNLDPEKQAIIDMLARNYAAELTGINREKMLNKGRMYAGTALSGASFHPILNIPYVGTGIGGAMYDLGQGIVEGNKLPELAKRAGRGFVIGETIGAIPYVGKAASKTKAGQAVLNSNAVKTAEKFIDDAAEKFAQTKAYEALMSEFAPGREIYKKTVMPVQRKISAGISPFEKAYNEVLYDKIGNMRKELPKYVEKEVKVPATNRHYEGDYTSPKINKLLDEFHAGTPLENVIKTYKSEQYPPEEITEIYNKFKGGTYKRIEGTPEHLEIKKVYNEDYVPLYKQSPNEDIIEHYESGISTDKIGHGYSGYSMSNNAVDAYNKGNKPLSKWGKKDIVEAIKNIGEKYDIPIEIDKLKSLSKEKLINNFLKNNGYHHTSKFYNTTDFYIPDIEQILNSKEVLSNIEKGDKLHLLKEKIKNYDFSNKEYLPNGKYIGANFTFKKPITVNDNGELKTINSMQYDDFFNRLNFSNSKNPKEGILFLSDNIDLIKLYNDVLNRLYE